MKKCWVEFMYSLGVGFGSFLVIAVIVGLYLWVGFWATVVLFCGWNMCMAIRNARWAAKHLSEMNAELKRLDSLSSPTVDVKNWLDRTSDN